MIRVQSIDWTIIPLQCEGYTDPGGIQVFSVSLAAHGEGTEAYILVSANSPVPGPATAHYIEAQLRERDSDAVIAFLVSHAPGNASVLLYTATSFAQRRNVAAAAAVVLASCAWDQSDSILVTVNNEEFVLHTRYDGQHWTVSDSRP
jgi:hypothetical protein